MCALAIQPRRDSSSFSIQRRRHSAQDLAFSARIPSSFTSASLATYATYMPWYLTVLPTPVCSICSCDSPRCASCVRGLATSESWIRVHGPSLCQFVFAFICSCMVCADTWRRVALQQPGAHTCLHLRCQPALFLGPPQSLHAPRHAPRAALLQCPPVSAQCAHQRRHHRTDHTVHPPCGRAWHA